MLTSPARTRRGNWRVGEIMVTREMYEQERKQPAAERTGRSGRAWPSSRVGSVR